MKKLMFYKHFKSCLIFLLHANIYTQLYSEIDKCEGLHRGAMHFDTMDLIVSKFIAPLWSPSHVNVLIKNESKKYVCFFWVVESISYLKDFGSTRMLLFYPCSWVLTLVG